MLNPDEKIIYLIKFLPKVTVVNKLMKAQDRDIALSMMYMDEKNKEILFSFLSDSKIKRIKSEIKLHKRLKIKYSQYRKAVNTISKALEAQSDSQKKKSYLRPLKKNNNK
jgi:hypothetical protein